MRYQRWALVIGIAVLTLGCAGASNIEDLQTAATPRPPYGSLNLVMGGGVAESQSRQLFLDVGQAGGFRKVWPQVVANHVDNQSIRLLRYDFIEAASTDPATRWYATVLVRADNPGSANVSFFGRAGTYPQNAMTLNPADLFPTDLPETAENKRPAAMWVFLRAGNPVSLIDPAVIGRTGPYGTMPSGTTVAVNFPGLDFATGGAGLLRSDGSTVEVGNSSNLMDIQATTDEAGKPINAITTPAQTLQAERVPTGSLVSPVTSQWDLCFAYTPPRLGVTLTHAFVADGAAGGGFADGQVSATGGGFFLTALPGAAAPTEGINTLNWQILRTTADPVWIMGWSADVAAVGGVTRGQSEETLTAKGSGSALTRAQVRGYLSGLMSPSAKATVFIGAQDRKLIGASEAVLYEGVSLPLVGRMPGANIQAQFGQLLIGGRTLWYSQNGVPIGANLQTSDQTLVNRLGTTISFSAYLPR